MIKFGVLADVQYANQEPHDTRRSRDSIYKFLKAAGTFAERKLPFVVQLGDSIDRVWENHTAVAELFKVSGLTFRNVLGNHDLIVDREHREKVFEILNIPKSGYYSFTVSDPDQDDLRWRFVILNGMEYSFLTADGKEETQKIKDLQKKYALADGSLPKPWNGVVSQKQLDWLDQELQEADDRKEYALVLSHFPLFAEGNSIEKMASIPFLKSMGIYFDKMGVSTWNGQDVLDVLDKHPSVKAYLAGHLHEGAFGTRKNVHHITFKGMVQTPDGPYSIATLERDFIRIEGFGKEPTRFLKIK